MGPPRSVPSAAGRPEAFLLPLTLTSLKIQLLQLKHGFRDSQQLRALSLRSARYRQFLDHMSSWFRFGQGIRELIEKHTGQTLPPVPPRPRIEAYGEVALTQQDTLLSQLGNLVEGAGIYSETPKPMEEYNQWYCPPSTSFSLVHERTTMHSLTRTLTVTADVCRTYRTSNPAH